MNARIILTLATLAWTATIAYFVFEVTSEPAPTIAAQSFYGDLGRAAAEGATNAAVVLLVIIVWPLGLSLIWAAVLGWAALRRWQSEAPTRRRYRRERNARDRQAWTRLTSDPPSPASHRSDDREGIR